MSSASSFSSPGNLFCYCGLTAQLRTSKTPTNPGKKFHGCKNWQDGGCKFFKWEDEPDSSNNQILANEMIELRNKMLLLEAENKKIMESVELQFHHAQDIYVEEFSKIRQNIWKLEVFVAATWVLFIIFKVAMCIYRWKKTTNGGVLLATSLNISFSLESLTVRQLSSLGRAGAGKARAGGAANLNHFVRAEACGAAGLKHFVGAGAIAVEATGATGSNRDNLEAENGGDAGVLGLYDVARGVDKLADFMSRSAVFNYRKNTRLKSSGGIDARVTTTLSAPLSLRLRHPHQPALSSPHSGHRCPPVHTHTQSPPTTTMTTAGSRRLSQPSTFFPPPVSIPPSPDPPQHSATAVVSILTGVESKDLFPGSYRKEVFPARRDTLASRDTTRESRDDSRVATHSAHCFCPFFGPLRRFLGSANGNSRYHGLGSSSSILDRHNLPPENTNQIRISHTCMTTQSVPADESGSVAATWNDSGMVFQRKEGQDRADERWQPTRGGSRQEATAVEKGVRMVTTEVVY
ncbi:GRF zinc finger containing protein [Striga asiatica]|uniref:GRF zinc finger containing protein n=1 Tax=Striga asiatica TaxID=4170 RepID=A0A5A7QHG7_STRAF|nr:GRF zinc finger containing protein [Striga asiatica]